MEPSLLSLPIKEKENIFSVKCKIYPVDILHFYFFPVDPRWREAPSDYYFGGFIAECGMSFYVDD